jgi:DNA repair exonuclease SbcCD nuclease subunit
MKLLHIADTHLGFSAYRKLTDDGINQREKDVYDSFTQCIEYALSSKPQLVLHAGDLFDSVRPTNRALNVALKQLLKLSKAGIPFVVISGNHETPRLRETGNIFTLFEHLDNVYPIYKNKYEALQFESGKHKICIHAIPHCHTKEEFKKNVSNILIDPSAHYNVLVAHGAVTGIQSFSMNEFNELFIPFDVLKNKFDYIALGHYHIFTKVKENVYYAGSTERMSFAEAEEKKGLIEVSLGNPTHANFISMRTRPMIDCPPLDCTDLEIDNIMKKLRTTIQKIEPRNKIVRLQLKNISSHQYRALDFNQIRHFCKGAIHVEIKADIIKEGAVKIHPNQKIDSIAQEYEQYVKKQNLSDRKKILDLGLSYIQRIEAKDEGT